MTNQVAQSQTKILPPVVRGCKTRRAGMTYMVTDPAWFRKFPLSYFLFDPPILVENPTAWGLSAQGISYVNKGGVIHAQDWIGMDGYPNAADVLEECVNIGGSGLVPLTNQIGQLTPGKSRRLLFHPAGYMHNVLPYKQQLVVSSNLPDCAKPADSPEYKLHKEVNNQMCSMLHWQHVTGGTPIIGREVSRKIGDTTYFAVSPIEDVKPDTALALIAWLPIDELHIVQGDDDKVNKALELLSKISDLPFFVTNV